MTLHVKKNRTDIFIQSFIFDILGFFKNMPLDNKIDFKKEKRSVRA